MKIADKVCERCGWPLYDDVKEGCTAENCSQRPLPPFPQSEHAKREARAKEAIEELTRAYNQKDDVLFDTALKEIRGLLLG